MWRYCLARLLEKGKGDLPLHAREIIQELIEGFATLEVVEQILHRHTSACENRHTALYLRIDRDKCTAHDMMIR